MVDYAYDCDWCQERHGADSLLIEIVNAEDLSLCPGCDKELKEDGYIVPDPEEPDWGYFWINKETDERKFYAEWESFQTGISELAPTSIRVGFWKEPSEYINDRVLRSFLAEPDCGMTDADIITFIQKLESSKSLYIGIRNHVVARDHPMVHSLELAKHPKFRGIRISGHNYSSACQVTNIIQSYLDSIKLLDAQILVTAYGMSAMYHPRDLPAFCFPDQNPNISIFDCIEELVAAKWDWREAPIDSNWLATNKFLHERIEQCTQQMEQLQTRIADYRKALTVAS